MLSRSKAVLVIAASILFVVPLMVGTPIAVGAEKGKVSGRNAFFVTDLQPAEVTDLEGHAVTLVKAK